MDEALKDVEKEMHEQVEKIAEALNTNQCLHTIPCVMGAGGPNQGWIFQESSIWFGTEKFVSTQLFQLDSLILRLKATCLI